MAKSTATQKINLHPTHDEELALIDKGYELVAGLDEVGRGPLAGPVLAGAVILPHPPIGPWKANIRDSKKLSPLQRMRAVESIQENAVTMATGQASNLEIDSVGIVNATMLAMKRAIEALPLQPQFLLLDAFPLTIVNLPQKAIIRGDAKCLSIAAASIIAKVERDSIMVENDSKYPGYGFAKNKGYGSKEHLQALQAQGPCPIHRYSFSPVKDIDPQGANH